MLQLAALVSSVLAFEPLINVINELSLDGCSTQANNQGYRQYYSWNYAPSVMGTQDGVLVEKAYTGAWAFHDASFADQEFDQLGFFFTILGSPEELWYFALPDGRPFLYDTSSACIAAIGESDSDFECYATQIVEWYTGESFDLPFPFTPSGIFPGYDFVVFSYDNHDAFLKVDTLGTFEELNVSLPSDFDPDGCAYESMWGIAETFDDKTFLLYRQDDAMWRTELAYNDTASAEWVMDMVAGDLCSFSVSLEHQLWALQTGYDAELNMANFYGGEDANALIGRCPAIIHVDDDLGEIKVLNLSYSLTECDFRWGEHEAWNERNPGFMGESRGGVAITDETLFFASMRSLAVLPIDFTGNGGPAVRIYANGQYYNLGNATGVHSVPVLPSASGENAVNFNVDRLVDDEGNELLLGEDFVVAEYALHIFVGIDSNSVIFGNQSLWLEFDFDTQTSTVLDLGESEEPIVAGHEIDIYEACFYRKLASGEYVFYSNDENEEKMRICVWVTGGNATCEFTDAYQLWSEPGSSSVAYQDGQVYFWNAFGRGSSYSQVTTCSADLLDQAPYIALNTNCSTRYARFIIYPLAPIFAAGDELLFRTKINPVYNAPVSQFDAQWGWEWQQSITAADPVLWFTVLERPFAFVGGDISFSSFSYSDVELVYVMDLTSDTPIPLTLNGEATTLGPFADAAVFTGSDYVILHGIRHNASSPAEYYVVSLAEETAGEVMILLDEEILFDLDREQGSVPFANSEDAAARSCGWGDGNGFFYGAATYQDDVFSIIYINLGDYIIHKTIANEAGGEGASTTMVRLPEGQRFPSIWTSDGISDNSAFSYGACSLFVSYTLNQWFTDVSFGGFHKRMEYFSSSDYYYDTLVRCPADVSMEGVTSDSSDDSSIFDSGTDSATDSAIFDSGTDSANHSSTTSDPSLSGASTSAPTLMSLCLAYIIACLF